MSDYHPGPIEGEETKRHVLMCALVVEVLKDTNINGLELVDVVPNLAHWIDSAIANKIARDEDDSLFYIVRDVTLYSEANFKADLAEHGPALAGLPDVRYARCESCDSLHPIDTSGGYTCPAAED